MCRTTHKVLLCVDGSEIFWCEGSFTSHPYMEDFCEPATPTTSLKTLWCLHAHCGGPYLGSSSLTKQMMISWKWLCTMACRLSPSHCRQGSCVFIGGNGEIAPISPDPAWRSIHILQIVPLSTLLPSEHGCHWDTNSKQHEHSLHIFSLGKWKHGWDYPATLWRTFLLGKLTSVFIHSHLSIKPAKYFPLHKCFMMWT
jgi:hypothetical protein